MQDLIDSLTLDDIHTLSDEQQMLVDCVGLETYKKLLKEYSGVDFHVAKSENVTRAIRNRLIFEEFKGSNIKQLAVKFRMTERNVRIILKKMYAARKKTTVK